MGASESKLTFKESVFRLRDAEIPAGKPWWDQFYQLPETADDVFSLWSPADLRDLTSPRRPRGSQDDTNGGSDGGSTIFASTQSSPPKNLETLIYTVIARLETLQTRHVYSDPHQPIAREVLNCVRILTRLLPYLYEAEHLNAWVERFFWKERMPARRERMGNDRAEGGNSGAAGGGRQEWEDEGGEEETAIYYDGLDPQKKIADKDGVLGPPLGEVLVDVLVKYLFFPGFTLPKVLDEKGLPDLKVQYHIWDSGIGCRQRIGMSKENERNAMEVLRLLLALSSKQLYLHPGVVADVDVEALTYMTTKLEKQVVLSIICSLLNTVIKYNPVSWKMPVDAYLGGDSKQMLVSTSIQFLLVIILYPVPGGDANAFRKAVGRLHRVEDFQFIQQGLATTLTQPVSGVSSYLPAGQKLTPWTIETLILFWELIQVNKRFRAFIIDTERAHDFVVLVLYYAMEAKDDPAKQGIVRMCILILQTLSVEPSFGKRLNKPFIGQESVPTVMRIAKFHGTYADFLITTLHALMTTTKDRLESVYPAMLAIIHNIAAYVRDLERAPCLLLLDLFAKFSAPQDVLTKPGHHDLLFSVLEIINTILDHQYQTNRRFVAAVVRNRKRFWAMRDFTVEGALAELDRQAQERKDRGIGESAALRSPIRNGSLDSVRSPNSARSPSLGNVPEHGAFAIGDDEDDDDESVADSHASMATPQSASASVFEDAVPTQQRSMSQKARGKQPIGQGSFSRSTSRNTSTTSLPALNLSGPFVPTADWLNSWLPYLPLHRILETIDNELAAAETGGSAAAPQATSEPARSGSASDEHAAPTDTTNPIAPEVRVQAFQWTSLALGWYISLLWGYIYAADMATNKGTNGIWTGTAIKLFNILSHKGEISLRSPRGAVDAVGDTIARRIGSISLGRATGSGDGSSSGGGAVTVGGGNGGSRTMREV